MKKKTLLRLTAVLLTVILFSLVTLTVSADRGLPVLQGEVKARIPELFEVKQEASVNYRKYQVGGDPFGVRLFGGGIVVVGISDGDCPAKAAGIEKRDIVRCVGGTEVYGGVRGARTRDLRRQHGRTSPPDARRRSARRDQRDRTRCGRYAG